MRRVWEFAKVTGAGLLLAALLLFGGQQALLGAEVQAGEAGIRPLAGNAIRQSGGVVVEPTSLIVSEPADSNTFRLYLTGVPTESVSISLAATTAECLVSPAVVVLDAGNWELGATATVTAVDDAIADGDMDCTIQTGTTTSADGNYDGLEVDDVVVTVKDDDEVGILVVPTSLTVGEPSGS
ncbi:MAG: hypothetical protein GX597_24085, partial [Anaerolineaceae bacterium]|nr:hypothetical protein [Anaerolineaceae bacterium]